jgi:two-component system sensor histidine kinase KdpD
MRVYLGAAPGVGKTYRMLDEGRRRRERGQDVVVALVETYNRPKTVAQLEGLEILPRRVREYRGVAFEEMDLEGTLRRHPEVALVDELPHTNVPGGRHAKRWQDVQALLDAGIDVITTLNVQHLESLNDVVEKITRVPQRETVPDEVVRAAEQIELVDSTPEALRRRMAHGNIYTADKVDAALSNYFRVGNLTALRELALLWLADRVDEGLQRYRVEHGIAGVWEARERVVVALTGGKEGATLIRRAARIVARTAGGDLLAVHVTRGDGIADTSSAGLLAEQRRLVESLGGSYHSVVGDDVAASLLQFAKAENATQLVVGTSRRSRMERLLVGGIGESVIRGSGDIDVHMVNHERAAGARLFPRRSHKVLLRRMPVGPIAAVALPALAALILSQLHGSLNLTSQVLVFLVAVVGSALLGGLISAVLAALVASTLLNYFFIIPLHQFTIAEHNNILALIVFVVVAVTVATIVDKATRQTTRAGHASAEAETLASLAMAVLAGDEALGALLRGFRETFGIEAVSLLTRAEGRPPGGDTSESDDPAAWVMAACDGDQPCATPGSADVVVPAGANAVLALRGHALPAADHRVLTAFAAQTAVALERRRLAQEAAAAKPLAEADRMRTALLAAVSHDLRTPLAAAKASITSLRDDEIDWSPEDHDELLATADESLDRLARLVANLLDMSRLQAGALNLRLEAVGYDEVTARALDGLDAPPGRVVVDELSHTPEVLADPALAERVVANLIGNALRHAPRDEPIRVTASALADMVELRVVDRGPGIPEAAREQVFQPFQRLGDRDNGTGVGLGLALSRGLVEAMGGGLVPEETPGGGLTMVVSLPAAGAPYPLAHDADAGVAAAEVSTTPIVEDHE